MPVLGDLLAAVREPAVQGLVGDTAYGAGGETVTQAFIRILTALSGDWPIMFAPTAFDIGHVRIAAIDLADVAPQGSPVAARQTAAFYLLARHALTRHWWIGEDSLGEPKRKRTLATLYQMLSMMPKQREAFAKHVRSKNPFAGGLTHIAVQRQAQVGKEEGGSNFTTIANQLAFLNYPELLAHTQESSFNPLILAGGKTDLFVVAPEETIEHVKGWLRLWVAIPNAVAGIKPLERDLLIVIDEMPRLG